MYIRQREAANPHIQEAGNNGTNSDLDNIGQLCWPQPHIASIQHTYHVLICYLVAGRCCAWPLNALKFQF